MARFLFAWELGQGLGHLVRYKALISALIDDGHEVFYLARDGHKVRLVNPQAQIQVGVIHPEFIQAQKRLDDPHLASYATLLFNCGFSDGGKIATRVRHWLGLFNEIKPDCIISDHSPTAVLANRISGYPIVLAGNGFTLPPAEYPLRLYHHEQFESAARNTQFEKELCDLINASMHQVSPTVREICHLRDLLIADQSWLMTFEELDCYGQRDQASYFGTFPNESVGVEFEWPEMPGPRIFMYLHSGKGGEELANWARDKSASLCVVMPNVPQQVRRVFDPSQTHFAEHPVKFSKIAAEADLGVTNGSSNSLANLVLAGLPQLALPVSMENYMEARRLEIVGCGLMTTGPNFAAVGEKLDQLLCEPSYGLAARSLAKRYARSDVMTQTMSLQHKLYELVG